MTVLTGVPFNKLYTLYSYMMLHASFCVLFIQVILSDTDIMSFLFLRLWRNGQRQTTSQRICQSQRDRPWMRQADISQPVNLIVSVLLCTSLTHTYLYCLFYTSTFSLCCKHWKNRLLVRGRGLWRLILSEWRPYSTTTAAWPWRTTWLLYSLIPLR